MAIRFQTIVNEPAQRIRTANDVAPLDCRMAALLPKIDEALPKITETFGNAVKRGRPRKEGALTPAEKQRRYRERKRQSGG